MHHVSQASRQASYMLYHDNIDFEDIWKESDFSTTIENLSEPRTEIPLAHFKATIWWATFQSGPPDLKPI